MFLGMNENEKDKKDIVSLEVNQEALKLISEGFLVSGIKSDTPFKILSEGLTANKTMFNKFGDSIVEPDHQTRHKFLTTALELMRVLKPVNNSVEINNNFTFAQMVETATRETFNNKIIDHKNE